MHYFSCAVGLLILLYVLGLGITLYLLPEFLLRYSLIIAPWVGYCYVTLISWHVFYFGGRLGPNTTKVILIPPALCLLVALAAGRLRNRWQAIMNAPVVGALAVAALIFVVISIPVFGRGDDLTTVSLGNNDIAHYAAISRFLSEFTRCSADGFVGEIASSLGFAWFAHNTYFGPFALAAFEGRLIGLMPHQDLSLSINLMFSVSAATVLLLLYDALQLGIGPALFGVAFVGFHPIAQYVALEGFFGQIVGSSLAVLIFWTSLKLAEENEARSDVLKLWLLLTLFTAATVLSYPHMIPFVWFFTAIYFIAWGVIERNVHPLTSCLIANASAALATVAICPQRVQPFFGMLKTSASAVAGWFIPWMTPDYIVALLYKNPFLETPNSRIHMGLSIFAAAACVLAIYLAYRNGFQRVVALSVACGAVYIGCGILAFIGQENGVLGGYKSFKLASFFMFFFGAAVVSLLSVWSLRNKTLALVVKALAAVAVFLSFAVADSIMLQPSRFARVESNYNVLLGLDRATWIQSINVLGDDFWRTMWIAYFLMHQKLYLQHPSYYPPSDLVGEYDLVDRVSNDSQIVRLKPREKPAVVQLNGRFSLSGPVRREVTARLGAGWYLGEAGRVWSGKDGRRASIILHCIKDSAVVGLKLACSPLQRNDTLTIQVRGERFIPDIRHNPDGFEEIKIAPLFLYQGDNEVEIMSAFEPIHPNRADSRLVSHLFSAVEVEEL